jgi:hypothetical protein
MQGKTVSVNYATASGSASAPNDYANAGGTLTFAPGQTQKNVTVDVVGDTLVEPNEAFDLVLSGPVNAALAGASATAIILNDDVRGAFGVEGRCSSPSFSLSYGACTLLVGVRRSRLLSPYASPPPPRRAQSAAFSIEAATFVEGTSCANNTGSLSVALSGLAVRI